MFEVLKMQQIPGTAFNYNAQNNIISFFNGSEIFLKDLFYYPSDPDFDELGSLEITGAFIDEASQVTDKAKNIVKSRIRYKLDTFGLIPKLLMTTNPTRGWIYDDFYKPYTEGTLDPHRKFIESLYSDNINVGKHYESVLDSLDETSRKRLKLGDWDYLDDPSVLVDYDAVSDLFTNDHVHGGNKRLSADLAMRGRDKFVVMYANGGRVEIVSERKQTTGKEIESILKGLMLERQVGHSSVIVDSDGMGAYLESYITGIKEFHGNGRPIQSNEFNNIKSQCGFKLAEMINKRELYIHCNDEQRQELTRQILNCLKQDKIDIDDNKKRLISKEKMKQYLGNSPDHFDTLLMLMWFYLRKEYF
jgi:hypothetical protein